MLLEEIITLAEQESNGRYQFEEETLVAYANEIQKMAYSKPLESFKVWTQYLRICHTLIFNPDDYSVIASDIGKNVLGQRSGAVGKLISYDSIEKTYRVYVTSGEFEKDEIVSVQAGTGTGTLVNVEVFLGPYSIQTDIEAGDNYNCRTLVGVTAATDKEIFGTTPRYISDLDDYGVVVSRDLSRDFYIPGRLNTIKKTFTFVSEPVLTKNYYRWIYFLQAPTIKSITDDESVIIPEEFHYKLLFKGILALQDENQYGTEELYSEFMASLMDFWEAMGDQHNDFGNDNHRRLGW